MFKTLQTVDDIPLKIAIPGTGITAEVNVCAVYNPETLHISRLWLNTPDSAEDVSPLLNIPEIEKAVRLVICIAENRQPEETW